VGPRAGLEALGKRVIPIIAPCRELNPGRPTYSLVSILTEQSRLQDNIKMNLKVTGSEGVHWIHVAQYRDQWRVLLNTAMKFRVLKKAGDVLTLPPINMC
jgi:hypothetical protein